MLTAPSKSPALSGYCQGCASIHQLPSDSARIEAERLAGQLEAAQSVDLSTAPLERDKKYATAPLFGEQRGKMFGVLHCLDRRAEPIYLYAFSGQFNGQWLAPGWVPPLFDMDEFHQLNDPEEKKIKELGAMMSSTADSEVIGNIRTKRRELSRNLMRRIHGLYRLHNFRGEQRSLTQVVRSVGNLPTGIGDCCAPKLINFAARNGYVPISLSEFFFGRENSSGTRQHKQVCQPCEEKCQPLLGFLLCGLD